MDTPVLEQNLWFNNGSGRQVIQIAEADGYDMFVQWAKLIQILEHLDLVLIMAQLFTLITGLKVMFCMIVKSLYNTWFSELDQIVSTFSANTSYSGFSDFDATYNGSIPHWIKMANSLRLRLGMRIVEANPTLQELVEKAVNDPGGLITTNADNMMLDL